MENANAICENKTKNVIEPQTNSVHDNKPKELSADFNSSYLESQKIFLSNVPISDQYTSVSNTLRQENHDNQTSNDNPLKCAIIRSSSRNNNVSFSDDEVTSTDPCVTTSQQSMVPLIESVITESKTTADPDTNCGFSSACPAPRIQSLATKKVFLLFFCLSLVLQGMYYTYFVSVLTTIEKLFQIKSQTTGIIMSAAEAGQIIGGLILPFYGSRGNRPKWIAGGIVTFAIGTLLSATPQLYLDGSDIINSYTSATNSSSITGANVCSYVAQNVSYGDTVCQNEESSALPVLWIFFLSLLAVGIGQTTVQNLGFPYLDDNVDPEESPSYFGITMGVRIFGPTLGFIFGSFCLRFYIDPLRQVDFEPTDPRWLGAWWLGIIFISVALFCVSIFISLFPKRLPTREPKEYSLVNGNACHTTNSLSTIPNGDSQYSAKSPSSIVSNCEKEYTYIDLEGVTSMSDLAEDSSKNIPISYIETPSKVDGNCPKDKHPDCCPLLNKISLYLPRKLLKSKRALKLKTEKCLLKQNKADFWPTILRLLQNKVLLLRTASSVLHLLPIAGLYTFLPKYLETQFDVTVHSAAMISGVGGILVMGIGIATSSYVIRRLKLTPTNIAAWVAIAALLYSIGMFILMLIGCPKENYGSDSPYGSLLCNSSCHYCDKSLFAPICSSDRTSYLSACHTGCSGVMTSNITNELTFFNCECLGDTVTASLGKCDYGCQSIILYVSIFCIFVFIHSTSEVGAMMLTMRCVEPSDKAMALGLISAAVGLFGNVPCPIIYGSVIDYSCLWWKSSCDGPGACQLYDTDKFRHYFHGTTGLIMFLAFIVDLFVVKYSERIHFDDLASSEKRKNHKSS